MATSNQVELIVSAENQASKVLKGVENDLNRLSKAGKKIGSELASAGRTIAKGMAVAGVAVAGLGYDVLRTGISFEKAMSSVQAKTGATGEELQKLEARAREMGAGTVFSATESAEAMDFLAMAGFNTEQIMQALPDTLNLAAAGGIDLANAADIASNMMSIFNIEAEQMGRVSDVIAKTATTSNTSIGQMAEAMKFLGPITSSLGVSLEETAASIGILGNSGIQGSIAGQALSSSLSRLSKPTKKMSEEMSKMGLNAFNAQGEFVGLSNILTQMEEGMSGYTDEQKQAAISTIFGMEATKQWTTLLNEGGEALSSYTKELEQSDGASQKMADTMTNNTWGAIKRVSSAYEEIKLKIFDVISENESLQNVIDNFAGFLTSKGPAIADFFSRMTEKIGEVWTIIQPAVEAFKNWAMEGNNLKNLLTGVMVAIGVALGAAAVAFLAAQSTIIAVFTIITGAVMLLRQAWDSNWGGIQEKVAAFGAWIMMLYQNYIIPFVEFMILAIQQIKLFWEENGDLILTKVLEVWQYIYNFVKTTIEFIAEVVRFALEKISKFWSKHGDSILMIVLGIWNMISGAFKQFFDTIQGIMKIATAALKGDWGAAWQAIKELAGNIWEGIKTVVGGAATALLGILIAIFSSIASAIGERISATKQVIVDGFNQTKSLAEGIFRSMTSSITSIFNGILGPIGKVIDTISGWISGIMDSISDAKSASSSLDKNAFGGPVTQGVPTIVGEREPEVFVPHQSGSIKTMDQVGGMGGNFNITINSTVRNDQDTRNIALELEKLLSRNNLISKNGISVG